MIELCVVVCLNPAVKFRQWSKRLHISSFVLHLIGKQYRESADRKVYYN